MGTLQIPHFSIPQRSTGCCGASGNRQNLAQGEWVQCWEPWISSDSPVSVRDTFAPGLFSGWLISVENWKMYFCRASVSSPVKWKVGLDQFRGSLQAWSWVKALNLKLQTILMVWLMRNVHNIHTGPSWCIGCHEGFLLLLDKGEHFELHKLLDLHLSPLYTLLILFTPSYPQPQVPWQEPYKNLFFISNPKGKGGPEFWDRATKEIFVLLPYKPSHPGMFFLE